MDLLGFGVLINITDIGIAA